jgi:hypothetical protein
MKASLAGTDRLTALTHSSFLITRRNTPDG